MFVDPTARTTERKSANTYNYYTLWMDNDPAWASFPKRSRSLICSTSLNIASSYKGQGGKPMVVIPVENCTIGVCSAADLWESFRFGWLSDLTYWLHKKFEIQWPNDDNENMNYQELIRKLKRSKY